MDFSKKRSARSASTYFCIHDGLVTLDRDADAAVLASTELQLLLLSGKMRGGPLGDDLNAGSDGGLRELLRCRVQKEELQKTRQIASGMKKDDPEWSECGSDPMLVSTPQFAVDNDPRSSSSFTDTTHAILSAAATPSRRPRGSIPNAMVLSDEIANLGILEEGAASVMHSTFTTTTSPTESHQ
jgi:hypothetical protein